MRRRPSAWLHPDCCSCLLSNSCISASLPLAPPHPNAHLPQAPAFLTPESLKVVVDTYGLKVTDVKDPAADVAAMMSGN